MGMSEADAKKAGMETRTIKLDANYSGRFMAENEGGAGMIKIVTEKSSGRILGMQVCASYASEFIAQAAVFIELGMKIDDLKEIVFRILLLRAYTGSRIQVLNQNELR